MVERHYEPLGQLMEFIGNCVAAVLGIILVVGGFFWMAGSLGFGEPGLSAWGIVLILFSSFFLWFSFSDKRYPPIR